MDNFGSGDEEVDISGNGGEYEGSLDNNQILDLFSRNSGPDFK